MLHEKQNTEKWFESTVNEMTAFDIKTLYDETYKDTMIKFSNFKVESFAHANLSYTAFCKIDAVNLVTKKEYPQSVILIYYIEGQSDMIKIASTGYNK